MIIRALKTNQINSFLYCIWAYNKNYILKPALDPRTILDIEETDSDEEAISAITNQQRIDKCERLGKLYNTLTLDYLIKQILEYCSTDFTVVIRDVANWGI